MAGNVSLPSPQESEAGPEPRAGRWTRGAKGLKADRGEAVSLPGHTFTQINSGHPCQ